MFHRYKSQIMYKYTKYITYFVSALAQTHFCIYFCKYKLIVNKDIIMVMVNLAALLQSVLAFAVTGCVHIKNLKSVFQCHSNSLHFTVVFVHFCSVLYGASGLCIVGLKLLKLATDAYRIHFGTAIPDQLFLWVSILAFSFYFNYCKYYLFYLFLTYGCLSFIRLRSLNFQCVSDHTRKLLL